MEVGTTRKVRSCGKQKETSRLKEKTEGRLSYLSGAPWGGGGKEWSSLETLYSYLGGDKPSLVRYALEGTEKAI